MEELKLDNFPDEQIVAHVNFVSNIHFVYNEDKTYIIYTMAAVSQRTRSVMEGGTVTQGVRGDGGDVKTIPMF